MLELPKDRSPLRARASSTYVEKVLTETALLGLTYANTRLQTLNGELGGDTTIPLTEPHLFCQEGVKRIAYLPYARVGTEQDTRLHDNRAAEPAPQRQSSSEKPPAEASTSQGSTSEGSTSQGSSSEESSREESSREESSREESFRDGRANGEHTEGSAYTSAETGENNNPESDNNPESAPRSSSSDRCGHRSYTSSPAISARQYLRRDTPIRFHPYREQMSRRPAKAMPNWAVRCWVRVEEIGERGIQDLTWQQIHRAGLHLWTLKTGGDGSLYHRALQRIWDKEAPSTWPAYENNPPVRVLRVAPTEASRRSSVSKAAVLRARRLDLKS